MSVSCPTEVPATLPSLPWEGSAGGRAGGEDILGEMASAASSPSFTYPIIFRKKQYKKVLYLSLQSQHGLILLSGLVQLLASSVPGVVRKGAYSPLQRGRQPSYITSSSPW